MFLLTIVVISTIGSVIWESTNSDFKRLVLIDPDNVDAVLLKLSESSKVLTRDFGHCRILESGSGIGRSKGSLRRI